MSTLCVNWLAVCLYFVIMGMGIMVANHDDMYQDLTIYTQGVSDWGTPSWSDFKWADYNCPDGYESIYNEWLGTVEGNYTDDGVEKTDPRWKGPIPANPAVKQAEMFDNMSQQICGKRSNYSYLNATRVDFDQSTNSFNCPDGKTACATTYNKNATLCVTDTAECPVTELVVLPSTSTDSRLSDSAYSKDLSTGSSTYSLYLAFTSGDNSNFNNAPLQSITWANG